METPQLRQVLGLIEQLPQSGEQLRQRTWAVLEAARSLDVEALAVVERKLCELVATAASPERSSTLAVAVGALIEGGASPHELSRSLLVAFKRWLPPERDASRSRAQNSRRSHRTQTTPSSWVTSAPLEDSRRRPRASRRGGVRRLPGPRLHGGVQRSLHGRVHP